MQDAAPHAFLFNDRKEVHMKIGVFVPIGNNGWLISTHAPQYMPTFELNKAIVQKAEHYNFDFALSMIKLRGFGGKTEFWDHNLESFTLMAGLAAVTSRIQIYATAATLTLPPAIVARMASTIDSISGGRFGVNLVTGWQKPEYEQMGIWPGDDYFASRYDYLSEYVQVLRDLWGTGKSDFKGDYFTMNDCRVSPQPSQPMKVICAGQSDAGMAFSAQYADYNFCFGKGVNTPAAFAPTAARMMQAAEKPAATSGRTCCLWLSPTKRMKPPAPNGSTTRPAPTKRRWRGSPSRARRIPAPAATPTSARWPTPPRRSISTWAPSSAPTPASPACSMKSPRSPVPTACC